MMVSEREQLLTEALSMSDLSLTLDP